MNNGIEMEAAMQEIPDLTHSYQVALGAGGSDKLYYFHANHLGSGSLITDGSGDTYQTLAYAPFGEELINISNGDYDEQYRFGGKIKDEESGLMYFEDRYYCSYLGFTSTDQLWRLSPDKTSYHYCDWNPIMRIDPTGMVSGDPDETGGIPAKQEPIYGNNGQIIGVNQTSAMSSIPPSQQPLLLQPISMPQQPVATISAKENTFTENWSESNNIFAKMSYNIVNSAYITLQGLSGGLIGPHYTNDLTGGRAFANLDGSHNYKGIDAFVETSTSLFPMARGSKTFASTAKGLGYTNKLNAAQFSQTFKGNLSRMSASIRGTSNRLLNKGITWYNNQVSNGMFLFKAKSGNNKK
jgi:RHS repeat-associated protein